MADAGKKSLAVGRRGEIVHSEVRKPLGHNRPQRSKQQQLRVIGHCHNRKSNQHGHRRFEQGFDRGQKLGTKRAVNHAMIA